jgi:hypothetical protein
MPTDTTAAPASCRTCGRRCTPYRWGACRRCYERMTPGQRAALSRRRVIPGRPQCLHCRVRPQCKPRGLCSVCNDDRQVRDCYAFLTSDKYRTRGTAHSKPQRIPEPTATYPGTPERLAVLEARAAAGECLFHPEDAVREG